MKYGIKDVGRLALRTIFPNSSKIRKSTTPRIVDLRDKGNDPRLLTYLPSRFAIIDAPLKYGMRYVFPLGKRHDPFEAAVWRGRWEKESIRSIREVLTRYYALVQPASAAEWLGVSASAAPELRDVPPWAIVFPWHRRSIHDAIDIVRNWVIKQNLNEGSNLSLEDGFLHFGPVSPEKAQIEANRLYNLLDTIRRNGFLRHDGPDGDILATVLVNEKGHWRWLVEVGHHRVSVAAALGMKKVPVRIAQVVYRVDADIWPNVSSGLFPKPVALDLFDRLFSGRIPDLVEPWIDYLDSTKVSEASPGN